MPDQTTTLGDLRHLLRDFVRQREWEPFHGPKNLAMALSVEAAELQEHFLWIDDQEAIRRLQDADRLEAVADEIADVFSVCLSLCNTLNLDLSDIFLRKMAKNDRKYPVERVRGRWGIEDCGVVSRE